MSRLRLVVLGVLFLAFGCATFDPGEDTRIEAEVKARLVAEKSAKLTSIGVLSTNGTVYLSGTAESVEARGQAEALAAEVSGVKRVVNTLDVRPPASGRAR